MKASFIAGGLALLLFAHGASSLPITGVRTIGAQEWETPFAMGPMPDGGRMIYAHRWALNGSLRREDAGGNAIWMRHLAGEGHEGILPGFDVARDGGAFLAVPRDFAAPAIVRIAPDGRVAWARSAVVDGGALNAAFVHELTDGSVLVVVAGRGSVAPAWVARLTADGHVAWQRSMDRVPWYRAVHATALLADESLLVVGAAANTRLSGSRPWAAVIGPDGNLRADWMADAFGPSGPFNGTPLPLPDGGAVLTHERSNHLVRLTPDLRLETLGELRLGRPGEAQDDRAQLRAGFMLPSGGMLFTGTRWDPSESEMSLLFLELGVDFGPVAAVTAGGVESFGGTGLRPGFVRSDGTVEILVEGADRAAGAGGLYELGGPFEEGTDCPPDASLTVALRDAEIDFEPADTAWAAADLELEPFDVPIADGDVSSGTTCRATRPVEARFDLDLRPGGCPNPINMRHRGTLPAAVVAGTPGAAGRVEPASVRLQGVPALRCAVANVSAPWDEAQEDACCGIPARDGEPDLVCHFDSQRVAAALCAALGGSPAPVTTVEVELTAATLEGEPIRVTDCARLTGCEVAVRTPPASPRAGAASPGRADVRVRK